MLTLQFAWKGKPKMVSSMFIGTSPEFEFALYTLCFLNGDERTFVEIENYDVSVRAYAINSKYGAKVGARQYGARWVRGRRACGEYHGTCGIMVHVPVVSIMVYGTRNKSKRLASHHQCCFEGCGRKH